MLWMSRGHVSDRHSGCESLSHICVPCEMGKMLKHSAAVTGARWGRKSREMGASHELSTHVSHPRAHLCVHMQSSLPGRMHKGVLPALPETPLTKTTLVLTREDGEMAHRGVSTARKTNPSAKPHRGRRAEKKGRFYNSRAWRQDKHISRRS